MKKLFGQRRISSNSNLPENFLTTIEEYTAANGVLFVDLDSYSPYRPISLGVRAKLVDLKSGEFMWAIDETFDVPGMLILLQDHGISGKKSSKGII